MTEFFKPIMEFLTRTVDRYGVKFLVALGGDYAIYDLTRKGSVEGTWAVIGIVTITVVFFVARHLETMIKPNGSSTTLPPKIT